MYLLFLFLLIQATKRKLRFFRVDYVDKETMMKNAHYYYTIFTIQVKYYLNVNRIVPV